MIEPLIQRWQAMAGRERRLVGVAALVVAIALVYLVLIEPAWLARQRLARELPALRAQLARVDSLADEASRLAGVPVSANTPQALRARLEASIEAAGLGSALAGLQHSGSLFDVRFEAVAFGEWLAWLEQTARDARLRVVDVAVTRASAPGLVNARVSLEMPAQGGR